MSLSRPLRLHPRYVLLYLVIPVMVVILAQDARGIISPYYLSHHDPDYAYLFNGIGILGLAAPAHIDHPGTPLQMFVALVLKAVYPTSGVQEIVRHVLENPEWHLLMINYGIVILAAGSIFLAGAVVYRLTGQIFLALLVQAPPLVFGVLMIALPRVTPEPMLLVVSMLFVACLAPLVWGNDTVGSTSRSRLLGLVTGLGVATKLTFAPVLLAPLLAFRERQQRKKYIGYALLGFLLATLPLLLHPKSYHSLMRWTLNLFTRSGIYGQGPKTVIDPGAFIINLYDIVITQPLYMLIMLVAVAALVRGWMQYRGGDKDFSMISRVLLGLVMAHLAIIILFAKHHQSDRYLTVGLALSGFTLALAYYQLQDWLNMRKWVNPAIVVLMSVFFLVFAWMAWARIPVLEEQAAERRAWLAGVEKVVKEQYASCAQVHQDSSSPEFALFFGFEWAQKPRVVAEEWERFFRGKPVLTYDPGQKLYLTILTDQTLVITLDQIKHIAPCVILRDPTSVKIL